MWGSSTRNTRIERLWVEVGTQFARGWRAFFTRLGRLHHLDRKNPSHLWLLHRLFLFAINDDCNPLDGIHPNAINRYYGVEGARRRRSHGETGAGHASDDEGALGDDSDDEGFEPDPVEELENQIQADQAQKCSTRTSKSSKTRVPLLQIVLSQPDQQPEGYGILPDEWQEEGYSEVETIRTVTNGKELVVVLPRNDWFPRAVQWVQALDLLTRVLHELDDE
ncbi:hypothetical protein B0H14DRAFT_3645903 [Mycena olivaceomarginata]|nr:hypothetical protein B0H14DRAFT_3645903 [Mycena olivaceomarginata]